MFDGDAFMTRRVRIGGGALALVLVSAVALWGSRWVLAPGPEERAVSADTVSGPTTDGNAGNSAEALADAECVLTVIPTSVVLQRTPNGLEAGYARAESGKYAARGHTTVTTGGDAQHWYKITAEGKTGWIQDNTLTVIESNGCPP